MNRVLKDWLLQARNNEKGQKGLERKRERERGWVDFVLYGYGMGMEMETSILKR